MVNYEAILFNLLFVCLVLVPALIFLFEVRNCMLALNLYKMCWMTGYFGLSKNETKIKKKGRWKLRAKTSRWRTSWISNVITSYLVKSFFLVSLVIELYHFDPHLCIRSWISYFKLSNEHERRKLKYIYIYIIPLVRSCMQRGSSRLKASILRRSSSRRERKSSIFCVWSIWSPKDLSSIE